MVFSITRFSSSWAIAAVAAGLSFGSLSPALAGGDWNQFDACSSQLIESGVAPEQAGTACSDALIPKELSECVAAITGGTSISGLDALQNCYQVRRPVDLGNCVVDIVAETPPASAPKAGETTFTSDGGADPQVKVLESCRASLLPGRYSECVIALSRSDRGFGRNGALETCLSAEAFPKDIFPAYAQ